MNTLHSFAAAAACIATFALAGTASAATLTVTNLNDGGSGSLRNAIASAAAGDTIQFQVTGTITLTSGELYIGQNLTITGPGASQLAISGNHASRVFEIGSGITASLSGLTIENGFLPINAPAGGAGIYSNGALTITNCTITGNNVAESGDAGGGILSYGALTLDGSTVTDNSAGYGGGISNEDQATVKDSTIAHNSASSLGGGIHSSYPAPAGIGLTLVNSTVSANSAGNLGGGIFNSDGAFAITGTTMEGNSAPSAGGIYQFASSITPTTAGRVLLASNSGGNCFFAYPLVSQGYNLSDDNSCAAMFKGTGDQNGVAAGLAPAGLQSNGGPTQTIALLANSPAVDAVPVASCTDATGAPLTTDQRGVARPQGKACDIGAFELVQTVPFSALNASLVISTHFIPGFALNSLFTLGSGAPALQPQTQALTLQIANYTLTLPAGSLKPVWNAPTAPYAYEGTINGAQLAIVLIPLSNSTWSLNAAGTPVKISATNPVPVTLTIGQNTGTANVRAVIQ